MVYFRINWDKLISNRDKGTLSRWEREREDGFINSSLSKNTTNRNNKVRKTLLNGEVNYKWLTEKSWWGNKLKALQRWCRGAETSHGCWRISSRLNIMSLWIHSYAKRPRDLKLYKEARQLFRLNGFPYESFQPKMGRIDQ